MSVPVPTTVYRFRVLFNDGEVVDFVGPTEDRAFFLKHHYPSSTVNNTEDRIAGVVRQALHVHLFDEV